MSRIGEARERLSHARRIPKKHPAGWEPGVEWDGSKGVLISAPTEERPKTWDDMLLMWGLDPAEVEVVGPVQRRSWHSPTADGPPQLLHYWKANVQRISDDHAVVDAEALIAHAMKRKAPKMETRQGRGAFVVLPADLQAGKFGTEDMVLGYKAMVAAQVARYRLLRKMGHEFDRIVLPWMGDLVEACSGFYAQQTFTVELDARSQRRLVRHLVLWTIDQFAALGVMVIVTVAGGNHGENRDGATGQSYTTFADNSDIEAVETVAEACEANEAAYGHVSFVIPEDELSLTLDVSGVIAGFAHGHQAKNRKASPQEKLVEWWKGQMAGQRPVGDAQILYTAHYHQPFQQTVGPRWMHGCPTADMGSPWFEESYGLATKNGLLSMVVGEHLRHGWSDAWIA
jgi:hypothetical protein